MEIDSFWFKVLFVIGVTIAQGILWTWAGLKARREVPGWSLKNLLLEFWQASKEQAGKALAAADRTFRIPRRSR